MKKTNKKYITLASVALLALGGVFVYNQHDNLSTLVFNKQVESAVGRIDISAPYTEEAQFELYGENEEPLKEASWMRNFNGRGYVVQKDGTNCNFVIKVNNNVELKLALRGPDKRDENNKLIENWVDFTSVTINGEEILPETKVVWHNTPFVYTLKAKADSTYKISVKWKKHQD